MIPATGDINGGRGERSLGGLALVSELGAMNDPLTYIEKTSAETKPVGFWRVYGLGVIALWVMLAARSFTRSYGTWAEVYSIVFAAIIAAGWIAAVVSRKMARAAVIVYLLGLLLFGVTMLVRV